MSGIDPLNHGACVEVVQSAKHAVLSIWCFTKWSTTDNIRLNVGVKKSESLTKHK